MNIFKTCLKRQPKTIGLKENLPKPKDNLARALWLAIYKSSVIRPLQGDILYDQTFNNSFRQRFKSMQYNAALAITDATRNNSREKFYRELG